MWWLCRRALAQWYKRRCNRAGPALVDRRWTAISVWYRLRAELLRDQRGLTALHLAFNVWALRALKVGVEEGDETETGKKVK